MTYFGFLFRFLIIPILIFLGIPYWANKNNKPISGFQTGSAVWIGIFVHVLLAIVYTTPWDNYLVATGVWYYNPKLVTGLLIGYVPIEEYTFFVLETILSGLWWWFLVRRFALTPEPFPSGARGFRPNKLPVYLSSCVLAPAWLASTYLLFFSTAKWTYLSITLFWALPPIFVQLLFGADILWHYRKLVLWAIVAPALYLSLMDIVALQQTTWAIAPSQTVGVLFFGILPLEEVVFFFVTNTLITFGLTLLLANVSQERFARFRRQVRGWKDRQTLDLQSR